MGKKTHPQEKLTSFWSAFQSKESGKITTIFPRALYADLLEPAQPKKSKFRAPPTDNAPPGAARNAQDSYKAAAAECRAKVARIVKECERTNQKFTDADFDIENDPSNNCLLGLIRSEDRPTPIPAPEPFPPVPAPADDAASVESLEFETYFPGSVHRVNWVFEKPQFTVNGYSSTDIKQGANGDCWWLAAVATMAHRQDLMERVCVARDEECGVYGFVFQRDGEWISTVVDDNLYLAVEDFQEESYDPSGKRARDWRRQKQTGSDALYFARCDDPNETWLPLLEKAYSKVHGDYESVSGGWPGQAVEDMTGGVATTLASNRVLRKDRLWAELLTAARDSTRTGGSLVADGDGSGDHFVFSLAAMSNSYSSEKNGLALGHAYSILQSREVPDEKDKSKLVRLVKIRNPWGQRSDSGLGEWSGPWSDGSREWTPYWLEALGHTFGDDGEFWMSFDDMLQTFMWIHRTRLFDETWTVVQRWTTAHVAWVTGYLKVRFVVDVARAGRVVLVLAQLDDRYFRGLSGGYRFELHFVLRDATTGERICRVRPAHSWDTRSVSCEVDLPPGRYEVLPKITATRRRGARGVVDVVREYADKNPQKLRQVGMLYDLAHAQGGIPDEDGAIEKERRERKKVKAEKERAERRRQRALRRAARAVEGAAKAIEDVIAEEGKSHDKDEKKEEKKEDAKEEVKAAEATPAAPVITAPAAAPSPAAATSTPDSITLPIHSKSGATPASTAAPVAAVELTSTAQAAPEAPAEQSTSAETPETAATTSDVDSDTESEAESEAEATQVSDSDSEPDVPGDETPPKTPWNAVSVIALRVYARDPSVAVTLVEPNSKTEAAALTVEGKPAGATM
ncbi:calpain-1 catalytic subunit [Plectosphaerella plurivora]|uniref:Calpain-1 catalytic subunit n=1 Tax=Plectosphaerella plurivora TaxID=936078 RepID=A0A9P8VLK9_9PEZI|nr:calpain-1 catalytic subunit [Plectosphaerella plurivora]